MFPTNASEDAVIAVPEGSKDVGNALHGHMFGDKWSFRAAPGSLGDCGQVALSTSWAALCRKHDWSDAPTPEQLTKLIKTEEYHSAISSLGQTFYTHHQDELYEDTWLTVSQLIVLVTLLGRRVGASAQLAVCTRQSLQTKCHKLAVYGLGKHYDITVFLHHNGKVDDGHWSGLGEKKSKFNNATAPPSAVNGLMTLHTLPSSLADHGPTHGRHIHSAPSNRAPHQTSGISTPRPSLHRLASARLSEAEQKRRQQLENQEADSRSQTLRHDWVSCVMRFQDRQFEDLRGHSQESKDQARNENLLDLDTIEDRMRHQESAAGTRKGRACALAWLEILGRGDFLHHRLLRNKELAWILNKNPKNVTTTATNKQRIVYPDIDDFERSRAAHKASTAITKVLDDPSSKKMQDRRDKRRERLSRRSGISTTRPQSPQTPTRQVSQAKEDTPGSELDENGQNITRQTHCHQVNNDNLTDSSAYMQYGGTNTTATGFNHADGHYRDRFSYSASFSNQGTWAQPHAPYENGPQNTTVGPPCTPILRSNVGPNGYHYHSHEESNSHNRPWTFGSYHDQAPNFPGQRNESSYAPASQFYQPLSTGYMNGNAGNMGQYGPSGGLDYSANSSPPFADQFGQGYTAGHSTLQFPPEGTIDPRALSSTDYDEDALHQM